MLGLMAQILIFRFRQATGSLLLCLIVTAPVAAQYRFDHWTAETGLPQNIITAITQTPEGYLWVATLDGLTRFDGVRFTLFSRAAGCSDVTVEKR